MIFENLEKHSLETFRSNSKTSINGNLQRSLTKITLVSSPTILQLLPFGLTCEFALLVSISIGFKFFQRHSALRMESHHPFIKFYLWICWWCSPNQVVVFHSSLPLLHSQRHCSYSLTVRASNPIAVCGTMAYLMEIRWKEAGRLKHIHPPVIKVKKKVATANDQNKHWTGAWSRRISKYSSQ